MPRRFVNNIGPAVYISSIISKCLRCFRMKPIISHKHVMGRCQQIESRQVRHLRQRYQFCLRQKRTSRAKAVIHVSATSAIGS